MYVKVCVHVCLHACACEGVHVHVRVLEGMCVHTCVYMCACVCEGMQVRVYVRACGCVCVRSSLSTSLLTRAVCFSQSEWCFVGVGICISLTAVLLEGDLGVVWALSPGWVLGGGEPADAFGEVVRFARGRARSPA